MTSSDESIARLKEKPWLSLPAEVTREICIPKGFTTTEERQCYYYLAKHLSGAGHIIDGGACFGASTYAFAAGLAVNPSRGTSRIHSYDRFIVAENYVGDMIKESFRPLTQEWGDDFFDIFTYQVGKYSDLIDVHRGDFMQQRWDRSPIEVLFIDIAKSKELHDHIIQHFYPSLIPGTSLLLHQDFYFCWIPYIHIGMQYFAHRFEVLDPFIPSATRLYRLKDAMTSDEIEHVQNLSREERLDLLDAFIAGEQGDLRAMAHVVKMCQLWYDKDEAGYATQRARLIAEFGLKPETNWGNQCLALDALGFKA